MNRETKFRPLHALAFAFAFVATLVLLPVVFVVAFGWYVGKGLAERPRAVRLWREQRELRRRIDRDRDEADRLRGELDRLHDIDRRLDEATASGDPERMKAAVVEALEAAGAAAQGALTDEEWALVADRVAKVHLERFGPKPRGSKPWLN